MTIEQRAEKAAQLKQTSCNCCQAVLCALADQTGLSEAELLPIGSGFAVGMGNMEATCGALVGAVAAAGLALEGRGTLRYARQLSEGFRASCGATLCKELKGRDTGRMLCSCEDCVRNAVLAYGELVGLKES
ncbi:MAG: C-GCAxxG-C-C family protein [Oscillospiraceae bacterium]|nr:C-GCAxxG-C-C family protein [Oscillospiraceae bacterium]